MEKHVVNLNVERDKRYAVLVSTIAKIIELYHTMESDPETTLGQDLMCENYDHSSLSSKNMEDMKLLWDELSKKNSEMKQETADLWEKLKALWNRLETPDIDKKAFELNHEGHGKKIISTLREQIAAGELLKFQNMQKFIDGIRKELVSKISLYDKYFFSNEQRKMLTLYKKGEIVTKTEAWKNQKRHDLVTLNLSTDTKKDRTQKRSTVLLQSILNARKLRSNSNTSLTLLRVKNEVSIILGPGGKKIFQLTSGHSEKSAMKKTETFPMIKVCDDCTIQKMPKIVLKGKYEMKDKPDCKEETSFDYIWQFMKPRVFIPRSDSSLRNPVVNMLLNATVSPGFSHGNHQSQASPNNPTLFHPTNITGIAWQNFERETMRFASFSRYPVNSVKSATVLANSGFVYVGEGRGDKVICYFCYAVKENWKPEEDVEEVHKQLSPNCPMITITESNNTATLTSVEEATSTENYNYSSETSSDQQLAAAASGYSHRQQPRATPAFDQQHQLNLLNSTRSQPPISQAPSYTSISVSAQTNSLPPLQNGSLHPNINSQIYSIPRVPLSVPPVNPASQPDHQTTTPLVRDLNLQDLGIFYERPKKPEYAILAKRIETFQGWPVDSPVTKEDVAKSGLYYEGTGFLTPTCQQVSSRMLSVEQIRLCPMGSSLASVVTMRRKEWEDELSMRNAGWFHCHQ